MIKEVQVRNSSTDIFRNNLNIEWQYISQGSIYAAEKIDNDRILIGGSSWNRKNVPYSPQLAKDSPGIAFPIKVNNGSIYRSFDAPLQFPSMVNSIIAFDHRIMICCKHQDRAFNLFDQNLNLLSSVNDDLGLGLYNALYDQDGVQVIAATRNGGLHTLNPIDLKTINYINLNSGSARLWSLEKIGKGVVAGDYEGRLYFVPDILGQDFLSILPKDYLLESIPSEFTKYQPSLFGLTSTAENMIISGSRWGQITWFRVEGNQLVNFKACLIPFEISYLRSVDDTKNLLIGTRQGSLLYLEDNQTEINITPLITIKPSCQNDNSIWSISSTGKDGYIISFADGQVVGMNFSYCHK